ncbi:MAG: PIN domain-containing protein [Bacillota bacterium]
MALKIARILISLFGVALGPGILVALDEIFKSVGLLEIKEALLPWAVILIYIASGLAIGIIFFIFAPRMIKSYLTILHNTEKKLSEMPLVDIVIGVFGLLIGLLIAFLLSTLTARIPSGWISIPITTLLYVLLGYLGWTVGVKRRNEVNLPAWFKRSGRDKSKTISSARPKILDTSVIIDGRIFDICTTGIMEGTIVIPNFVLQELRHIADSSDVLKRNRGRRGLDILNRMQKELEMILRIEEKDYDDIAEVDSKLLRLALDLGGVVVTNDYNLNKVAAVQNVPVFNINELANAIKPVVLPGEEMRAVIVKEGKEMGQGVAYLDDGTMIVVDGGKKFVGSELEVVVTSVLQTAAGRMIFARIK